MAAMGSGLGEDVTRPGDETGLLDVEDVLASGSSTP
jgi:hypothetical protein